MTERLQRDSSHRTLREFAARHPTATLITSVVLAGLLLSLVIYTIAGPRSAAPPRAARADEATLWTCAMHPQIQSDRPGMCPLCGMDLVPVKKTASASGLRTLTVTPDARALMNVLTVPVERKFVTAEVRMVGKVEYDETRLGYITAWVPGRLDRLYVDYTGIAVNKGDHLASIYSPELYSAQEELIQSLRYSQERGASADIGGFDLVASAREKLRLLGLTDEQIAEIEQQKRPSDHVTLYASMGGVVVEKLRKEGDYVTTGERIYTVADLSHVWVKLDAYESDLVWLRYGQEVKFTTEAYPGEEFVGRISFIQPVLDDRTRTVKVRVNLPNPEGKLKPGMFVRGVARAQLADGGRVMDPYLAGKWICPMHPEVVEDGPGECPVCGMALVPAESLGYGTADAGNSQPPLVIPKSAALITGTRAIVYVEVPDAPEPTYDGREIVLGPEAGDYYLVRKGLEEGELVVTNGAFKIDSEIQIQARPSMMTPEGGGGGGHDHGGNAGAKPSQEEPSAGSIPAQFHEQLDELRTVYLGIVAAVDANSLPQIQAAFSAFGDALDSVDSKRLEGHPAMVWKEMKMLLGNDAWEGKEVDSLDDAHRVFGLMKQHIQRMEAELGHAPAQHAHD